MEIQCIPVPLSNAGSTGIGEYDSTNISQDLGLEEGHQDFEEITSCII